MSEQPHSDKKSPGFWFYTADFEKDMQILSLASQGLWARMLCWMHDNEAHRGFLELPTGLPMTNWDIGAKVGKTIREIEKAIAEMQRVGIFSRDDRGCIFSRRMARETHISQVRADAAKRRLESAKRAANGEFAGDFAPANQPAKEEQNPTVTASASASDSSNKQHAPETGALVQVPPRIPRVRRGRSTEELRQALGPERLKWWEAFKGVFPCNQGMKPAMDVYERTVHTRELAVKIYNGAKAYAADIQRRRQIDPKTPVITVPTGSYQISDSVRSASATRDLVIYLKFYVRRSPTAVDTGEFVALENFKAAALRDTHRSTSVALYPIRSAILRSVCTSQCLTRSEIRWACSDSHTSSSTSAAVSTTRNGLYPPCGIRKRPRASGFLGSLPYQVIQLTRVSPVISTGTQCSRYMSVRSL